jgi:hypothetical protein
MTQPKLMFEPSQWLEDGIHLETHNGLSLFKFSDSLQNRSDALLELSRTKGLNLEEQAELDSLSQLSEIFTYANSSLAANAKWYPPPSENLSQNVPNGGANIAIPQRL